MAAGFHDALAERNGAAACARLNPATVDTIEAEDGRPCAEAVLAQGLPRRRGDS